MNILFLSLIDFSGIEDRHIYTDLLREFRKNGHLVHAVSPVEKKKGKHTRLIEGDNLRILKPVIGNIQKTNPVEKGLSTITLEGKLLRGIKRYFNKIKFDLVIYPTPPVTFCRVIQYLRKKDSAKSYLLLKDIFPQNAVDLGMLGKKNPLYLYFRKKEKTLYANSDYIGCMSEANVRYLLKNNPELSPGLVEVCPNGIEPVDVEITADEKIKTRSKYNIPQDKTVFIYGGNLGKPQGIPFLCECLRANRGNDKAYFVIAGSGTEFKTIESFINSEKLTNAVLLGQMPKKDYESLVKASDAGLIFLDKRFTIPNFPSRMLDYMQASLPVLAATDVNTDLGKVITEGNFGLWSESGSVVKFNENLKLLSDGDLRKKMGGNARKYLEENYTAKHAYNIIMRHF